MKQSPLPSRSWLDAVLAVARLLREAHARLMRKARPRAAEVAALRAEIDRLRSESDLLRSRIRRLAPANRPARRPFAPSPDLSPPRWGPSGEFRLDGQALGHLQSAAS